MKKTAISTALCLSLLASGCTTGQPAPATESTTTTAVTTESDTYSESTTTSSTSEETTETSEQKEISYSDSDIGSLIKLSVEIIGQDLPMAQEKLADFFGIDFEDAGGHIATEKRGDISTAFYVYSLLLVKGDIRFNELDIWTDENDGHIVAVEYSLRNSGNVAYDIDDSPELRSEIKRLDDDFYKELHETFGDPYNSGLFVHDEDSVFCDFKANSSCFIRSGIRDFTEEGGNGLMVKQLSFSDCEEFMSY